ncbi:MAG: autotransporter domain-containing protein [Akkermansia sp.]|nr:autotransporter domain-containing protein [Akkermansia sp.]
MKLHLNLALRRAVLAAMAMVAIHVAQAETTTYNGADAYIYGSGTIEANEWSAIWNKNKAGSLTIGTYQGTASVSLAKKATYNNGKVVFIGGAGNNSGASTANSGVLNIGAATLNVGTAVYVGNSQHSITGNLLTIDGGSLTAGNQLYVGAWAASGEIDATNATIKVNSGKDGAVFAMGWRESAQGGSDVVTLDKSTITVGAAGGVKDYTTIGRGGSEDTLYLKNGSTANFYDQTIVGEVSGSEGEIYVLGGSTLNLGETTVLGSSAGAEGAIYVEDGTVTASNLVVGAAGSAAISVIDGSLSAKNITLADKAGSAGIMELGDGSVAADLLTIGDAGTGTVWGSGELSVTDMVIGNAETGKGTLRTSGTITVEDELFVGYKGTGSVYVDGGSLTAKDAYVTGKDSVLSVEDGSVSVQDATVLAGTLSVGSSAIVEVAGELILDEDASLVNAGSTIADSVLVNEGSSVQVAGGTLTAGDIVNDGAVSVAGRIEAAVLDGDGETTITVSKTSATTKADEAIISLSESLGADITVDIDTENATGLVGKNVNFVKLGDELVVVDRADFSVSEGWVIDWDNNRIYCGEDSNGQQLSFTGNEQGMYFTKLGAVETKVVETESAANVKVELEVLTETTTATTETVKEIVVEETDEALKDFITTDDTVQSVELNRGVDENQEEVRTNVIIAKNVESTGDAESTKVQSIVVNQKTTVEIAGAEGEVVETKEVKETVGVSGVALVFEGTSKHEGTGKDSGAELGFKEDASVGTITTKDEVGNTVINEVSKIDVVHVTEGADVTVSNMNMHSTHALTVNEGATITLDGVNLHVGGTTDINLTKEVEVKVYDETGNVIGTETQQVETDSHLTTDTVISNATLVISGGSEVKFEKIDNENHDTTFGSTTIKESVVEIEEGSVLGDSAEHMQNIAFTGQSEVTNSGTVNNATFTEQSQVTNTGTVSNATFESGAMLSNNNGSIEDVVFSNGSHLKGKGNAKKVHVDKDSKLTVGSSPGVLKASDLKVDGTTEFFFITNSADWDTGTITANENTGAISQLEVDQAVTLNGAVQFIYQTKVDGEYVTLTGDDAEEARREVGSKITEDTVIKFVTGNIDELTLGTDFVVIEETLPILTGGLDWDYATLFTDGKITVVSEMLEEPTRIANTLVSAGDTVLSFGRLAGGQAMLREAGTTRAWASAIANSGSVDGGKKTNGYDSDAWGAAVGVDHAFAKNTVVGVAFARTYGENTPENGTAYYNAGSIDQDATMVGLYTMHKFRTKGLLNDVKLNAFAAYGEFTNESTRDAIRSGHEATAEWDSNAWVLSASLTRDITTDDGLVVSPYVGVEYTKATMDDATEKGRTYDAEYTADQDYSKLSVKVGMTVSKTFGSFTPYAGVAYINDVSRKAAEVTATGKRATISGKSALPGRDALQLKVGANWQLTEAMDLNAGYSAELRDKATEQSANVGIGIKF